MYAMQAIGEFLLTEQNIKIPTRGNIFSINEGYSHLWDETITEYVRRKKDPAVSLHNSDLFYNNRTH